MTAAARRGRIRMSSGRRTDWRRRKLTAVLLRRRVLPRPDLIDAVRVTNLPRHGRLLPSITLNIIVSGSCPAKQASKVFNTKKQARMHEGPRRVGMALRVEPDGRLTRSACCFVHLPSFFVLRKLPAFRWFEGPDQSPEEIVGPARR